MQCKGKRRPYSKFKQLFGLEDYISEYAYNDRCNFARLQISVQTQVIYTGRHARQKVHVNQGARQMCTCNTGAIEKEMYFVNIM